MQASFINPACSEESTAKNSRDAGAIANHSSVPRREKGLSRCCFMVQMSFKLQGVQRGPIHFHHQCNRRSITFRKCFCSAPADLHAMVVAHNGNRIFPPIPWQGPIPFGSFQGDTDASRALGAHIHIQAFAWRLERHRRKCSPLRRFHGGDPASMPQGVARARINRPGSS